MHVCMHTENYVMQQLKSSPWKMKDNCTRICSPIAQKDQGRRGRARGEGAVEKIGTEPFNKFLKILDMGSLCINKRVDIFENLEYGSNISKR